MVKMIIAEFKKLKGSSMLWIGIGSCFILPVMALGINLSNPNNFAWSAYVQQNLWPQIILLWPCIFGTFGSYIFCRERIENTYKNLLVIPVGRIRLTVAKMLVMFVSIMAMAVFTYVLNLSGTMLGVEVTFDEFIEGLRVYALAGLLLFVCTLPIMLVSIIVRKGFLLSICISILYALGSFLASWVAPLASMLPIDIAWRIMDLHQFEMSYSFPMSVSLISLAVISFISLAGILFVAKTQEA